MSRSDTRATRIGGWPPAAAGAGSTGLPRGAGCLAAASKTRGAAPGWRGVDCPVLMAAGPLQRVVEETMARAGARAAETARARAELEEAASAGGGQLDLEWSGCLRM